MANQSLHISIDHIPDDHLRGIGQVALSWAYLEGALERLIWTVGLLDVDEGVAITTHMNLANRIDIANSLMNLKFPDNQTTKELKKILKNVKNNLAPKRNEIVHSRVLQLEFLDTAIRTTYRARGKVRKENKPIELEEYEGLKDEIIVTANQIFDVLVAVKATKSLIRDAPSPLPNKPDKQDSQDG